MISLVSVSSISSLILVGFGFIYYYVFHGKRRQKIFIQNFEKDIVYLFQFPSSRNISCISPFAVKIETYLKLKNIPYKSIRTIKQWSSKSQIPFIEWNGQQIADSNFILDFLVDKFQTQDNISDFEKGLSRAVEMMLDNQTVWSYFYYRYVEKASDFINSWTFTTPFRRKIIGFFFPRGFKNRSYHHGIGRHSPSEIYEIGKKDLMAISNILGDRKFLLGDKMTTVDCYIFGHLCQILYIPSVNYPHIEFLKTDCKNLVEFTHRIIDKLWPEWNEFSHIIPISQ